MNRFQLIMSKSFPPFGRPYPDSAPCLPLPTSQLVAGKTSQFSDPIHDLLSKYPWHRIVCALTHRSPSWVAPLGNVFPAVALSISVFDTTIPLSSLFTM